MNILPRSRTVYQLVLHVPTGERYALRLEMPGYHVTGCLGPRNLAEWRRVPIETLDYDAGLALVPWANEHLSEFDITS